MTLGSVVLGAAVAAGAVALAMPRYRDVLARVHASALLVALALLVIAFLAGDLSYAYVWAHTDTSYPLAYRLAGTWGGEEGTLLLWDAALGLFLVLLLRREGALHTRAAAVLLSLSTALAVVLLLVGAFDATDATALALAPHGRGLADVLLTPLMVIHPPIQFVGYALIAVPAAFALAALLPAPASASPSSAPSPSSSSSSWVVPAFAWARVAWLVATVGLGLGALWAYYVLSFGGYWAWDPVEVSNLFPWLALTAFLHAGKHLEKFGDLARSASALAILGALFTLFATFSTRSGLWVSVHAFTDPTGSFTPDAPARLLAILAAHEPSRLLYAVMLAATFAASGLFLVHHARGAAYPRHHGAALLVLAGAAALDPRATTGALFEVARVVPFGFVLVPLALMGAPFVALYLGREDDGALGAARPRRWRLDPRALMRVAVALFALALAVMFLLDLQVVNGPDRRVFDVRAPYVVLPMVSALTVMMGLAPLGPRRAVALAVVGALGGVAAWWLFPGARTLALATPFLLAALVAVALKVASVQGARGAPLRARAACAALLAAGVLLVVLASNPPVRDDARATFVGAAGVLAGAALLVLGVRALRGRVEGARLRETGIYVIHLAVVLGLLGFAASTYSEQRATFADVAPGTTVTLGSHAFTVGAPTVSASGGAIDAVRVPLEDGAGRALAFEWRGTHYAAALDVARSPVEDVYVTPLAFHTASGWAGAGGATSGRAPEGAVDAVSFSVAVLPLMQLVWAGLWLGVVGMGMVLGGVAASRRGVGGGAGGGAAALDRVG